MYGAEATCRRPAEVADGRLCRCRYTKVAQSTRALEEVAALDYGARTRNDCVGTGGNGVVHWVTQAMVDAVRSIGSLRGERADEGILLSLREIGRTSGAGFLRITEGGMPVESLEMQAIAAGASQWQTKWFKPPGEDAVLSVTFTGAFPLSRHICNVHGSPTLAKLEYVYLD